MASVGMLCFFIFFVFGILAVQIWNGLMHQACFNEDGEFFEEYVCTITADGQNGMATCPPNSAVFGEDAAAFTVCKREAPNPAFDTVQFDNILGAFLTIFNCITLESWAGIMYMVQDGYDFWAWIYFIALIIIGAWFAVNLTLVVISAQFGSTKSDQLEQMTAQAPPPLHSTPFPCCLARPIMTLPQAWHPSLASDPTAPPR